MDNAEEKELSSDFSTFSRISASEFNAEMGMRERMLEAINARIAWAMLLKESLQADVQPSAVAPVSFRYAALDALKSSEKPIDFLLDKQEPAPPNIRLQEALRNARPAPRAKVALPSNPKSTFLYIRSTSLTSSRGADVESNFLILKCPVCSRTSFTSLQGLLNHARISHTLEWGTHEDCVRACAVADSDMNIHEGVEVGVGAGGILPGLRTIFKNAVGFSRTETILSDRALQDGEAEANHSPTSHLTKTLGLHGDTPALAQFLGKEPIRRGIKVYQEDEPVDVCSVAETSSLRVTSGRNAWRPRFSQRGEAQPAEERVEKILEKEESKSYSREESNGGDRDSRSVSRQASLVAGSTRFHFTTRIIVTDRSFWIDSDTELPFSHKWMLTVDSPSYSHNITTLLRSMRVTPLSSVDSVKCSQPEIQQPPFVIVGLASQPFLARVDLVFNGIDDPTSSSEGQPFTLEHWVDLDPLRSSTAVVGEEQICDVELDKRTHIRPANYEYPPTSFKPFWKLAEASSLDTPGGNVSASTPLAYEKVLFDLLPRFPLTLQESKRKRGMKPVPYKLVSSETQFSDLIDGRRKAIEWGRVRALRDAYTEIMKQDTSPGLPPLTAADVYSWLREEGHLRPHTKVPVTAPTGRPDQITTGEHNSRWCSLCGLECSLHSLLLVKLVKDEIASTCSSAAITGTNCLIATQYDSVTKLRPVDVQRLTAQPTYLRTLSNETSSKPLGRFLNEHIVRTADPRLTLEVRRLIHLLDLPTFKTPCSSTSDFPLDHMGQTPGEVDSTLAPYSLLTMCLRPFIRKIVLSGLDVAIQQKGFANTQAFPRKQNKKGPQDQESNISLLTPAHILTGIGSRGREKNRGGDRTDEAILLCLSGVGTVWKSRREEGEEFEKPVVVKLEQP